MPSSAHFTEGEPVTILAAATAVGHGEGVWDGRAAPVLAVRVSPAGRVMLYPTGDPAVIIFHGDVREILAAMAADALEFRKLLNGCRVCETGRPCPECVIDVQRQREYSAVQASVEPRRLLAAVPEPT